MFVFSKVLLPFNISKKFLTFRRCNIACCCKSLQVENFQISNRLLRPTVSWGRLNNNKYFHQRTEAAAPERGTLVMSYQTRQKSRTANAEAELDINHDTQHNLFFINLQGDNLSDVDPPRAKLEYCWISPSLVDMYHTEVPPQFQGRGIAKHLAKAAFDHFSESNITMRPTCTYLQKYLKDNPIPRYLEHVEKTKTSKH